MIDFTVAYDKLASFETAEEVRSYLASEGVKGNPSTPYDCPLSTWARETTGKPAVTCGLSTQDGGTISTWTLGENRDSISFPLTKAMNEFACNFDAGQYPELVNPEWWPKEYR